MPSSVELITIDPNQPYEGRLVGFDFGLRHIGVSVGQTFTRSAKPLTAISARDGEPLVWLDVDKLIKQWNPKALIVGIPLNMNDTPQPTTQPARDFAARLKLRYHLPVHGVDERLTTKDAKARLFEKGGFKALKKQNIDALSAALILESWMVAHCEDTY